MSREESIIMYQYRGKKFTKRMESLPELTGTEKQVNWALQLRDDLIDSINYLKERYGKLPLKKLIREIYLDVNTENIPKITTDEALNIIMDFIVKHRTTARYWIDNRMWDYRRHININWKLAFEENNEELNQLKREATVFPKERVTNSAVEIKFKEDQVIASFEKNDQFIEVVKSLGYRWNWEENVWYRNINTLTGSARDRAAELGNALLIKGFPICILDDGVREKAIHASFNPEHKRWILKGENNQLNIWWEGWNSELYDAAKSLPSAKWERPYVTVSVAHYKEIEDFSEMYNFAIHEEARKLIENYVDK